MMQDVTQPHVQDCEDSGPKMSQNEWPRVGRYIGSTGWCGAGRAGDLRQAAYQDCRVYEDEIGM